MKTDYAYCINQDTCPHRRGCVRFIGNYTDAEVKEWEDTGRNEYLDDSYCMDSIPYPFDSLDRFRLSNGEPVGSTK